MNETVLTGIRGDDNFYDFDITGDIDVADSLWFRAASKEASLTDGLALILKRNTAAGGTGIVNLDAPNGKFQVQLEPADTSALTVESLRFEVVVRKADVQMDTTVAKGVIRFSG